MGQSGIICLFNLQRRIFLRGLGLQYRPLLRPDVADVAAHIVHLVPGRVADGVCKRETFG